MPMTPIPALDRTSASFKTDVDTFFGSRIPTFVTEANALQTDVTARQSDVTAKQSDITTRQSDVVARQSDVIARQTDVANKQAAAAASAASAAGAPGTNASSTTSITIGLGSKSLTIETGKAYALGQTLVIANTATPTNQMSGVITAFNSGTGDLTINATAISGGGTFSAWTVALSGAQGAAGAASPALNIFMYNHF